MCKKKAVYTVGELSMSIMRVFNQLNEHCFNSELPKPVITFEQGKRHKAYAWIYTQKTWKQGKADKYGIVIATEYLDDLQNVIISLLHEMCHLYAMEKGIQDTSRNGYYHNDKFREIAEKAGLECTKERQGWATRIMSPELAKWIDDNCKISEIRLIWKEAKKEKQKPEEPEGEREEPKEEEKPKKKSGYYVYTCPECGAKIRSTKIVYLMCAGEPGKEHSPKIAKIEN